MESEGSANNHYDENDYQNENNDFNDTNKIELTRKKS